MVAGSRQKETPALPTLSSRLDDTMGAESLTTVFGMGTGVAYPLCVPGLKIIVNLLICFKNIAGRRRLGK